MDYHKLILQILHRNSYLTYADTENFLNYLANSPKSVEQIIKKTGLPSATVSALLKSLGNNIKENNQKYTLNNIKIPKEKDLNLVTLNKTLISIRKKYKLTPKRSLDQFFATTKTTFKKAQILKKLKLHKYTNIALLGDDDFVSIALALMYNTIKITVFEVDTDLINTINKIAADYNLNITTVEYQAKHKIHPNFVNSFDIALTDPPYTVNGVELFLDRCLSLIKPYGSVLINYGNSVKTPEKYLSIQDIFYKYNLFIKNVFYNFNTYNGAYSIGSKSSLYHLVPTINTVAGNANFEKIYTFEDREVIKFPYTATYSFKITNVQNSFLFSRAKIDENAKKFAKLHALKIVDQSITKFNNQGFTFNYTLSTSSFVIHTWPEYKALHIVIDVCSKVKDEMQMIQTLSNLFDIPIQNISFKKYL